MKQGRKNYVVKGAGFAVPARQCDHWGQQNFWRDSWVSDHRITGSPDDPIAGSVQALSPQVKMDCALGAATWLVANCPARHADDLGVLLTLHPEVEQDQVSFRKGEAAGAHTAVIKDVLIQQRVQVEYRDIQASGGFRLGEEFFLWLQWLCHGSFLSRCFLGMFYSFYSEWEIR